MDRRSWLWRRKSSDKSPGETESTGSGSGSVSSPSERFSDEQQAYSNQITQSPEVTSKAAAQDEDVDDTVKILSEKLAAAVASVAAKEELVKQHAKVAEEAVTGWEKAENEVNTLKQQLDAAAKKNTSLEDRIVHLDGALKECLRQLRQAREEQDQRIQEVIHEKSQDSEFKSSELEAQLDDLCTQLQTANSKLEAASSLESDLRLKLELAERENASLQLELRSRLEELEVTALERDLSTKTAETASKQHLEGRRKVAKLEAECRRLKILARKTTSFSDHRLSNASLSHAETLSDSNSESGERSSVLISEVDQFKAEKGASRGPKATSHQIGLMDDFLEMERFAASPLSESRSSADKTIGNNDALLKSELEAIRSRAADLEVKIEKLEAERLELDLKSTTNQDQLKISEARLAQVQAQLNECQNQVKISQAQLRDANQKLGMLQAELDLANELRQAIELELEDANVRREEAESQLKVVEDERETLLSKISFLGGDAEKERSLYAEALAKCQALEDEISRMKDKADACQSQLASMTNSKEAIERELSAVRTDFSAKVRKLEDEISVMKHESASRQGELASAKDSKEAVEREIQMTNAKKDEVESQLKAVQAKLRMMEANKDEAESQLKAAKSEAKSLLAKVCSLEREAERERAASADFASKCKKLEEELSKTKCRAELQLGPTSKQDLNIQQEKELLVAATKLADCQKTIASLGKQLKSLATLDDLFLESEKLLEVSEKGSQQPQGVEPTNSPSPDMVKVEIPSLSSGAVRDSPMERRDSRKPMKEGKAGLSSLMSDKSQRNGFGKLYPRSKSAMGTRNS